MYKKLFLIVVFFTFSSPVLSIEREDLNLSFFERFNDECLVYYINKSFENNHSAKQASHKTEQYRQQVKYSFAKELPSLSVSANYLGVHVPRVDNFQLTQNAFVLPFIANYEADFLLKNRDKTKSLKKAYEAVEYEEKSVYISLLTDVATVYTNILQYDKLINLSEKNLDIYEKLFYFDKKMFERGVINSQVLNNSAKRFEDAKNNLEELKKQRDILLMQLAVLSGLSPNESCNLKRGNIDSFEYNAVVPDNIESDVIFSRPDILSAEAQLQKAKIDVRVARKEFLPTFNITGVWLFNTIAPGSFFSWESSLAAIFAGAAQDIFTGGRKIANLKIKKAKYEELFENYKQTDLNAVKEVNSALCIIKYDTSVERNTVQKFNYERENLNSDEQKFNRGVISLPEYLTEMSNYINIQSETINKKSQRLVNYFTLYKAVGGNL